MSQISFDFRGAVVVVTGAGSGMGRAATVAFAKAGAAVAAIDRDPVAAESAASEVTSNGGTATAIIADVARPREISSAFDTIEREFGVVDVALNNAGVVGTVGPVDELEIDEWDRLTNINLRGVWLCLRHEAQAMRTRRRGSIINIASTAGVRASPGLSAYTAAKHGVVGLTRSAAVELAPDGIRVNAVCPGAIETPMLTASITGDDALAARLVERIPLGRLGTPQEVAAAVMWLASDAASYVTGHALLVDGGRTI